jgi:hypothetical protein
VAELLIVNAWSFVPLVELLAVVNVTPDVDVLVMAALV